MFHKKSKDRESTMARYYNIQSVTLIQSSSIEFSYNSFSTKIKNESIVRLNIKMK